MRPTSKLARNGKLYLLRIEIDGHFHGGPPVKPWVAEITGISPQYGLQREFLRPMKDWGDAHVAWSGNTYGVIATFPLREGRLYEVQRCEGNSSRRRVVRFFVRIEQGKQHRLEPVEALALVDGGGEAYVLRLPEPAAPGATWAARVESLGTPQRLGYVLVGTQRHYRCRDGLYEVVEDGARRLVGVQDGRPERLTDAEALAWLR